MKKQNRLTKCIWKVPNKVKKKRFEFRKRGGLVQRQLVQSLVAAVENLDSLPTLISMRSAKHPLYKQEQC